MKNIHDIMAEKTDLAKTYAEDGAFHSAARVLLDLAKVIGDHAIACDAEMMRFHTNGAAAK